MDEFLDALDEAGAETEDTIERFMGDEELYLKYVKSFPEEPNMGRLVAEVEEKDYAAAEKYVHALKGIVLNLGFLSLADASVEMLMSLRDDNVDEALEEFERVKEEYGKICEVICRNR